MPEPAEALEVAIAVGSGINALYTLTQSTETLEWLTPEAVDAIERLSVAGGEIIAALAEAAEDMAAGIRPDDVTTLEGFDASKLADNQGLRR
jgi:hypothetical protein